MEPPITIISYYNIDNALYSKYAKIVNKLYGFDLEEDPRNLPKDIIGDEYAIVSKIEPDVMGLLEDPKIKTYWNRYTDYEGILFIFGVLRFVDYAVIELDKCIDESEKDEELARHALYENNIRTELLKLWEFCENQEYERQNNHEITIKVTSSKNKIKLKNWDNYVLRSLRQFCKSHLPEYKNWDDAKAELAKYRKGGRPQDVDEVLRNNIMWGTYQLAQIVLPEEAKISSDLCRFIRKYLQRINLDSYSHISDEELVLKDIRKKVEIMVKNNYKADLFEVVTNDIKDPLSIYEDLYNDKI